MFSSQVGAISETVVELDLLRQNYNVLYPTVPARYDLLAEVEPKKYISIQVKTARTDVRDGNLRVTYDVPYDKTQVDLIAVYDPKHDKLYYIPVEDIPPENKGFTLRITKRKNKRKTDSLTASNYKKFPYTA